MRWARSRICDSSSKFQVSSFQFPVFQNLWLDFGRNSWQDRTARRMRALLSHFKQFDRVQLPATAYARQNQDRGA